MIKHLFCASVLISAFAASSAIASADHMVAWTAQGHAQIEHSGGCRKSSPAGQCCHGGSQPVHCH